MWSLGCILAELVTGVPLLPGEDEADQFALTCELFGPPPPRVLDSAKRARTFMTSSGYPRYVDVKFCQDGSTLMAGGRSKKGKVRGPPGSKDLAAVLKTDDAQFLDFMRQCLRWDPNSRMTPPQGLKHPWMRKRLPKVPDGQPDTGVGKMSLGSRTVQSATMPYHPAQHPAMTQPQQPRVPHVAADAFPGIEPKVPTAKGRRQEPGRTSGRKLPSIGKPKRRSDQQGPTFPKL